MDQFQFQSQSRSIAAYENGHWSDSRKHKDPSEKHVRIAAYGGLPPQDNEFGARR